MAMKFTPTINDDLFYISQWIRVISSENEDVAAS